MLKRANSVKQETDNANMQALIQHLGELTKALQGRTRKESLAAEDRDDMDMGVGGGGVGEAAETHDVIFALTSSQGSIALISALQAGFNFTAIASIAEDDFLGHDPFLVYIYSITTTLTIGISLFTCICGAILEQEGRIARGLALAKHGEERHVFEDDLDHWYNRVPSFVSFRTHLFWLFASNLGLFMVSLSLLCLLKMPLGAGVAGALIMAATSGCVLATVLWMNRLFREKVLQIENHFAAPTLGPRRSPSRGSLSSGSLSVGRSGSFSLLREERESMEV